MSDYPHVVDIYAPPSADADPYDETVPAWTLVAADVQANLQPLTGSVQQAAAGRQLDASWSGFVPGGTAGGQDYGIDGKSGPGMPKRFRVRQWGELGEGWDTEMMLQVTPEQFAPDEG